MVTCKRSYWRLAACLLFCQVLSAVCVNFSPCSEIKALRRSDPFAVGLAFWPGGLEADWGDPLTGMQPCNPDTQANLTAQGVMFATYNVRADRLTVLKTTFPEELMLTSRSPKTAPKVISVVAFRYNVRSDVRYIASFDPAVTQGTGFVTSLALLAKFELGNLRYLQFYNLTCNDCGGRTSARCINSTSCALDYSVCTCANTPTAAASSSNTSSSNTSSSNSSSSNTTTPAPSPSNRRLLEEVNGTTNGSTAGNHTSGNSTNPQLGFNEVNMGGTSVCNYGNFTFCATGINLAFEGVDANSAAFTTAAQIRKLSSYSLLSVYFKAKAAFFDVKGMFTAKAGEYWGNFGAVQGDIQAAYSGNQEAYVIGV